MLHDMPYDPTVALDTRSNVTVAEAAERLGLSNEQVRQRLRAGKLRGQRIGNRWFVEERDLRKAGKNEAPMFAPEVIAEIHKIQDEIAEYNLAQGNPPIDVLELIRQHREEA